MCVVVYNWEYYLLSTSHKLVFISPSSPKEFHDNQNLVMYLAKAHGGMLWKYITKVNCIGIKIVKAGSGSEVYSEKCLIHH